MHQVSNKQTTKRNKHTHQETKQTNTARKYRWLVKQVSDKQTTIPRKKENNPTGKYILWNNHGVASG